MPNTNSKQAIGAVIKDNEAEAIYNTAITAVNGLHAVSNMYNYLTEHYNLTRKK